MMKNTGSTRTFYLNSMILFFSFLLAACGGGGSSNSSTGGGPISSPPPSNSYADNCVANFNEWKDDPARPIVELLGSKVVQLRLGDSYEDAGALAYDDVDGDLSTTIVVHGLDKVNTQSPGDYLVRYEVKDTEGNSALPAYRFVRVFDDQATAGSKRLTSEINSVMDYWEHLPTFFGDDPNDRYPLVVFAHGWSISKEFDTSSNAALLDTLPIVNVIENGQWDDDLPMIVVTPQRCWSTIDSYQMSALKAYIDWMVRNYPVDTSRIYLTGLSNGGWVTWEFLSQYPQVVAAAAPIAAYGDHNRVCAHKDVPLWAFNARNDATTNYLNVVNMVSHLQNCSGGVEPKLTIFESGGHIISDDIFNMNFLNTGLPEYDIYDQSIFEWFLEHEKP